MAIANSFQRGLYHERCWYRLSKGKSTVTLRRPGDVVLMPPCDIPHTQSAINALIEQIKSLDGETKVCMEHTDRYEPVANWLSDAGISISAVSPTLIRDFGDDALRTPKTDKAAPKTPVMLLTAGQN